MRNLLVSACVLMVLGSCSVSKPYTASRKFAPRQLQEDYTLFQAALEEAHPSLYWYTPKDSMDYYFAAGKSKLTDSLTEGQFRNVLAYVISKVRCGHTTVRGSRAAAQSSGARSSSFPLFIKAWPDTVVVTANLNRRDTNVTRGVILTSIDGRPIRQIMDSLFSFLSADGYNTTHKYQTLSNGSNFRNLYSSVFGLKARTEVEYIDTAGRLRKAVLGLYNPRADTLRGAVTALKQPSKRERRRLLVQAMRHMHIDTALNAAVMEVNTFTKGSSLRSFFRRSFKELREKNIQNLVLDLRGNGGGSVTLSNLLTRYIADKPFTIADSLYAIRRHSQYGKYRSERLLNWLFLRFLTRRKNDGTYHFSLYENKKFKPRKKYNFNGTTYILTGGNTFSAASLITKSLKDQEDVWIVGEETGGGEYGNTAWLIPDITLPHTGVRFRLPLFRLVIDKDAPKGYGIQPEVPALPTVEAIRRNADYKMEKVTELIKQNGSVCTNATVKWGGDPKNDGQGWVLVTDKINGWVIAHNLPDEYKREGMAVHVCMTRTNEKIPCACATPSEVYQIRSIRKL